MADLRTNYLGLELANPLIVGACPLTRETLSMQRLEGSGAAAVVLPSLFEEQIVENQQIVRAFSDKCPDASNDDKHDKHAVVCDRGLGSYNTGPDGYLRQIETAKKALEIPVIASLNAQSLGGWARFARLMEQAGADAIELNIFFVPTTVDVSSQQVEQRYVEIARSVREVIDIPLAAKIGPYFAALPHFANRLINAGANGLVLFNRYLEPAFDIDSFQVEPCLELSRSHELRLPLRWIAILSDKLEASLAATSGIHTAEDALRAILAGADAAMLASCLLEKGVQHLETILQGMNSWLDEHDRTSIAGIRGLMNRNSEIDPLQFERASYVEALSSFRLN